MQIIDQNEDRPRGTYEFPFEFHHIDQSHPRYVMSYHWHVEYEIIRILTGEFTVTLDEKSFKAVQGDVIFVHSGILHSGIPVNCVYQCIVFDMNVFLKLNSVCADYIQKIVHQDILIFHHFDQRYPDVLSAVNSLFHLPRSKTAAFPLRSCRKLCWDAERKTQSSSGCYPKTSLRRECCVLSAHGLKYPS